ncbi:MAG TPA: CHASE domain-containing protein [Pyrinomonadaceae bacterium]|nr:CHASE domain-containing protein [Pyrinomonadaceae bacterium]
MEAKPAGQQSRRGIWSPYLVLAASLALTALAAYYVASSIRTADRLRFENAARRTQDAIEDRLDTYVALLSAGGGLFAARPDAGRAEFHAFAQQLDLRRRYPGAQGFGFAARVPATEADRVTARLREREGERAFRIRPEGQREEYFPILYLEPADERNAAAIGFDMFSEPVRREAMERARDTAAPAATGRVTLVQEIGPEKQAGFLIYVPVYEGDTAPASVEERRARLRGFVYSPFRADDLLQGIFGAERNPLVAFDVFDGADTRPENLLHRSDHAGNNRDAAPRFDLTTRLDAPGRQWTLHFVSRPGADLGPGRWFVSYVLIGGLLFSLVLFAVVRSQARARRAAERAAEELRASERRFRTLVEQSPLSTQIFAPDGRTLRVNRAWEKLWGVTLERLGEYNILQDAQLVEKGIMPYIVRGFGGETVEVPAILYDPEETIPGKTEHENPQRWVQAIIYPVKDEQGRVSEVVLVHEDITERRRLEEQLRARAEELSEANRLKDEFLATLSHELRTPLTAILGWAKLLRLERFDAAATARAIETIERNAIAQTQLIDDLLDVSRVITGKLRLNVRPVNLSPIIEAAALSARPAAEARGVELLIDVDERVGPVSGDADRLQQVVWNLLSNAIKFTPRGGRVEVHLRRVEAQAEVVVTDTGQGIAQEFLPFVFDRFRQADGAITREHGGLGLGLAIVRHLVELHGGQIRAESEGAGRGATFRMSFPLLPTREEEPGAPRPQTFDEARADAHAPAQSEPLGGVSVLVVDDDEDTRVLLKSLLNRRGAHVAAVASAAEALDALDRAQFDVLVSDIGMPHADGYELIKRVRGLAAERGGHMPAIALTAYAHAEDRTRALDAGFQLHVAKPVIPEELVAAVAGLAAKA